MSRFPTGAGRERAISEYLPTNQRGPGSSNAPDRLAGHDGDWAREQTSMSLTDQSIAKFRNAHPPVTPRDAYDNLAARGLIQPRDDAHPGGLERPAENATWASVGNGSGWKDHPRILSGGDARAQAAEISGTSFPTTHAAVVADTQRHSYVAAARSDYVAWATRPASGTPPGPGLTADQANQRFNTISARVGMTNPDGSVRSDWNPTASTGPAAAFYKTDAGHPTRFGEDGTVSPGMRFDPGHVTAENPSSGFQHGATDPYTLAANPQTNVANLDPVTAAQVQEFKALQGRNTTYAVLTGENFPGANPPIQFSTEAGGGRVALIPNPSGGEPMRVPVVGLNPDEAKVYMRSRSLIDESNNPAPGATANDFAIVTADANSRTLTRDGAITQAAEWERSEIGRTLSGPPYNLRGQPDKIVNFMAGQTPSWLGSTPPLKAMDDFRVRAAGAQGPEVAAVRSQVVDSTTAHAPSSSAETYNATSLRSVIGSGTPARAGAGGGGGGGGTGTPPPPGAPTGYAESARITGDYSVRTAEMSTRASIEQARINADATRYSADRGAEAQRYSADRSYEGQRLAAEAQVKAATIGMIGQIAAAFVGMFGQMLSGAMQGNQSTQAAIIQGMYSRR